MHRHSESRQKLIGLVSEDLVIDPEEDGHTGDGFKNNRNGVGAGFFPITKIATGIVRNNRPAGVTEVGIRSRVFQRLNGLCAFNSTPTSDELRKFDDKEVSVRSGTYTGTIVRSSVFQVFVRQAGLDESSELFEFRRLSPYFVVRGNKPVDQYNFIRFIHPREKEFEFKFVPIPASELRSLDDSQEMIVLNASQTKDDQQEIISESSGGFTIETSGYRKLKVELTTNREFIREPREERFEGERNVPTAIRREQVLPEDQNGKFRFAESMEFVDFASNVGTVGRQGAFFHEIFGSAQSHPGAEGTIERKATRENVGDNRWIKVKWTVEKKSYPRITTQDNTTETGLLGSQKALKLLAVLLGLVLVTSWCLLPAVQTLLRLVERRLLMTAAPIHSRIIILMGL